MTTKLNSIEDIGECRRESTTQPAIGSLSVTTTPESWVELSIGTGAGGLVGCEREYLRLLREAQRESRDSSAKQSRASSRRDSPKSPPNSPNLEPSSDDELKGVYINCWQNNKEENNDWVWEWSSRPDQLPPKDWRFRHPRSSALGPPSAASSIEILQENSQSPLITKGHCLSVRRTCLFSRGALAAVLVTNLVSLLIGAGIGVWLSKRGFLPPRIIIL